MPLPIHPAPLPSANLAHAPALSALAAPVERAAPPSTAQSASGGGFRDHLRAAARELARSERSVERAVASAQRGALDPPRLIEMQATIYRHSLLVDVASRLVEKTTSAVKQTLTSQS